jgi:hypothetical protein
VVDQVLASRSDVCILLGDIDNVLFDKPSLGPAARGLQLGKGDRDTGLLTRQYLFAVEVAAVGNDFQPVGLRLKRACSQTECWMIDVGKL